MPSSTEPPVPPDDDAQFLDWAFGRAVEFIEEGRESSADDLLLLRPALQEQVRELVELARRIAFGPKPARPVLQGYQLLEEIGHGGMGTVWLARQQRLGGRLVAVKVLPASMGFSPQLRARFRAEAQAIAKLRHPHIVDVYDVIEGGDVRAFAMEWVEGSTLAKVIERSKGGDASRHADESSMANVREALGSSGEVRAMPPDRSYIVFVCRVGVAIARALGAVHRAGIVHRDIKPSNILLRSDGTPLLSDFGLARDAESTIMTQVVDRPSRDGAPGGFAGTAAYAAPEQLRADDGEIDGRADIYALGATLYSALALRLPFQGHNHVDVLRQIQLGLVTPLRRINPKLPKDAQTIVAKAMEHDRSQRYQTGDELADDLERLLNLQPIRAKPAGWITRTAKLARRNRATLAAAVIGGSLAMLLVALTLTYVIGFPVWSKRRLDEARLTLLDPNQGDSLFSALYWNLPHANGLPVSAAAADLALANYDAAVRFAPFDEELALERDLVRLAREITQRPAAVVPPLPRDDLRLTASLAAAVDASWNDFSLARNRPVLDDNALASASIDDLRAVGLMAMLCGEPVTAMDAWEAHDLRGQSDPMIEACFGIAYLINGQHGRAYPRLRKAVEAFPNVGFLTVYLAEAAAKCGDLEKAQRWLDDARSMPRLDQFNGLKRVQAGLYDSAGNDEAARKLYQELLDEKQNVVAFYQYARFLENHNELEPALLVHLRCFGHGTEQLEERKRFVAVTERWWAALSDEDRRALAAGKDQHQDPPYERDAILFRYAQSLQVLNEAQTPDGLPRAPQAGRGSD